MFYTIYYINLKNINFKELLDKLHKIGFPESYLNDFTFCPYLIIHKDFKDNKTPVYENINEGYLKSIKSKCILVESFDIDNFINNAYKLLDNYLNTNTLF